MPNDLTTSLALFLRTFRANPSGDTLVSQSTGGVDETLNNTYEAFRFTLPSTAGATGAVVLRLKAAVGTTAGAAVRCFIYGANGSGPTDDLIATGAVTGYPTSAYVDSLSITSSYTDLQFRIPVPGLTPGGNYWIVLKTEGVLAGSISIERRSSGTGLWAFSSDAQSWTLENNKEAVYEILDSSGNSFEVSSETDYGLYATTQSGWGVFAKALGSGSGVKGESLDGFGVGGTSRNYFAGRFSSTSYIALAAVSTGNYGAQIQGTTGGLQAVASGAGSVVVQAVDLGGSAQLWQGLNSVFSVTSQIDHAGNAAFAGTVTAASGTATPAGGSASARLLFGTTAGFGIYYGSGAPTVSAAQGSLYLRSDGSSTTTRSYINTNGGTTWTAITTAA